jgi:hypothetical protein
MDENESEEQQHEAIQEFAAYSSLKAMQEGELAARFQIEIPPSCLRAANSEIRRKTMLNHDRTILSCDSMATRSLVLLV